MRWKRRVRGYRREWLAEVTLSGAFAWGRLWGGAGSAIRVTPISIVPREQLDDWLALAESPATDGMSGPARDVLNVLATRGPTFPQNLPKAADMVPAHVEMGLADLLARGWVTCDSFAALRQMITPPSRRRRALHPVGRWCCFRRGDAPPARTSDQLNEMVARQLLARTGVVFRRAIMRERVPVSWSALTRVYRRLELRGEVRGGRFVAGFSGEQFALPKAVELLRHLRRQGPRQPVSVISADPLNFQGILTPEQRVAPTARRAVLVG
jgi:ATP-dependent helicase Lhr and Lhr-like helicase